MDLSRMGRWIGTVMNGSSFSKLDLVLKTTSALSPRSSFWLPPTPTTHQLFLTAREISNTDSQNPHRLDLSNSTHTPRFSTSRPQYHLIPKAMASNNPCNGDDVNPPAYSRLHEDHHTDGSARKNSKMKSAIELCILIPVLAIVVPPAIVLNVGRLVVGE